MMEKERKYHKHAGIIGRHKIIQYHYDLGVRTEHENEIWIFKRDRREMRAYLKVIGL